MKKNRGAIAMASVATMFSIAGCGAWKATKDGTVDAAKWVFTTQVKTMNVDLDARAAVNETTAGQPLSTVVRLYQLKDSKAFSQLEYAQLQNNDLELLKADIVATKDVVMRPGSNASVSEPMDKDAEFVGVVAFFRQPTSNGVWKLLIPKKQWKDTDPVRIHVQNNMLAYEGANPRPVKREAAQQSTHAQKPAVATAASGVASNTNSVANASDGVINPSAALGEAGNSSVYATTSANAAAQNVGAVADSAANVKSGVSAASRSVTKPLPK